MPEDEERDPQDQPDPTGEEADDAEGQVLTWKVRKPIPEVEDDAEGHAVRPPPELLGPIPALSEDDAEGHGGSGASSSGD